MIKNAQLSKLSKALKEVGGKSYLSNFLHFYICYRAISPGFKKCSFAS